MYSQQKEYSRWGWIAVLAMVVVAVYIVLQPLFTQIIERLNVLINFMGGL